MSMCNMNSKMWTVDELKEYEGELWYDIEFEDRDWAFVQVLKIYAAIQEDPVYEEDFYHEGEVEKFLESLGDIFI